MMNVGVSSKRLSVAKALDELCKSTRFNNITVSMICQAAGLSKTSFYRIFRDKYDVALWVYSVALRGGLAEAGRTRTLTMGLASTFEYVSVFKNLLRRAGASSESSLIDDHARRMAVDVLCDTAARFHGTNADENFSFMVEWVVLGVQGVIRCRLADGASWSSAELAQQTAACFPPALRAILDAPVGAERLGQEAQEA